MRRAADLIRGSRSRRLALLAALVTLASSTAHADEIRFRAADQDFAFEASTILRVTNRLGFAIVGELVGADDRALTLKAAEGTTHNIRLHLIREVQALRHWPRAERKWTDDLPVWVRKPAPEPAEPPRRVPVPPANLRSMIDPSRTPRWADLLRQSEGLAIETEVQFFEWEGLGPLASGQGEESQHHTFAYRLRWAFGVKRHVGFWWQVTFYESHYAQYAYLQPNSGPERHEGTLRGNGASTFGVQRVFTIELLETVDLDIIVSTAIQLGGGPAGSASNASYDPIEWPHENNGPAVASGARLDYTPSTWGFITFRPALALVLNHRFAALQAEVGGCVRGGGPYPEGGGPVCYGVGLAGRLPLRRILSELDLLIEFSGAPKAPSSTLSLLLEAQFPVISVGVGWRLPIIQKTGDDFSNEGTDSIQMQASIVLGRIGLRFDPWVKRRRR